MIPLFEKISEKLCLDIDIDLIESKFIEDQTDPSSIIRGYHSPYSHSSKKPHWQYFPSGISFARNFDINFKYETELIIDNLKEIRRNYIKDTKQLTELSKILLTSPIKNGRVNLLKIKSGTNVQPHHDDTRSVAINIGLKNSNSCITNIGRHDSITDFWNLPYTSFTVNDGDVYLLNVKYPHSVTSLVSESDDIDRYLITYTLKF